MRTHRNVEAETHQRIMAKQIKEMHLPIRLCNRNKEVKDLLLLLLSVPCRSD